MQTNSATWEIDNTIDTPEEEEESTLHNVIYLIIYSLIIAFSLSLNEFFHLLLSHMSYKNHIIAQMIYLIVLFGIMILLTFILHIRLKF